MLFEKHLDKKAHCFFHNSVTKLINHEFLSSISTAIYCNWSEASQTTDFPYYSFKNMCLKNGKANLNFKLDRSCVSGIVPFLGDHNYSNFLASLLVCEKLTGKIPDPKTWKDLPQIPGRLELVSPKKENSPILYIDFCHTPESLEKALLFLKKEHSDKKLWVLFGCGGDRDQGKREIMGAVADAFADQIILTSDNSRTEDPSKIIAAIKAGIKNTQKCIEIIDRKSAILEALRKVGSSDCILFAGKGHEDYQEANGVKSPLSEKNIINSYYIENN